MVNVVTCLLIKAAILNHRVPLRKLRLRALMTMTTGFDEYGTNMIIELTDNHRSLVALHLK